MGRGINMEEKSIVIYQTEDGQTHIDVRLENETVWLTQKQIAELFGTKRPAITKHLKNIYSSEELDENSTCSILEHMGNDGKQTYSTKYYNLDVILSVGYRVNSKNATRFRQWANKVLKSFLVKGYAVNERLRKEQIAELRQLVGMLGRTIQSQPVLSTDETSALFEVVTDYSYALDTLDNYEKSRGQVLIHSDEEYLVVTRKICIFALYNVNKHSMLRQKREKNGTGICHVMQGKESKPVPMIL